MTYYFISDETCDVRNKVFETVSGCQSKFKQEETMSLSDDTFSSSSSLPIQQTQDPIHEEDMENMELVSYQHGRRTYLVTYSEANLQEFPTPNDFGEMVVENFNSASGKLPKFLTGAVVLKTIKMAVNITMHLSAKAIT